MLNLQGGYYHLYKSMNYEYLNLSSIYSLCFHFVLNFLEYYIVLHLTNSSFMVLATNYVNQESFKLTNWC